MMQRSLRYRYLFALFLGFFSSAILHASQHETALDRYVHAPDAHYRYDLVDHERLPHLTVFHIRMVSQAWRTTADVAQPEWVHWLEIYVPDAVEAKTALLVISGSYLSKEHPASNPNLARIAEETKSVVADLHDIPNEPFKFVGDPKGERVEDAEIAYTWRKYLETGDATWPLRLPMTKAAVRAMDTVTNFVASKDGGQHEVNRFVLTGASKRGWTVWTTAAVDSRVCAIVPIVIDVLNMVPSMEHHYQSYGFWAQAVQDYKAEGIMEQLHTEAYKKLMEIEDPFSYRDRFTMPKLLIGASGDQFFLPDSSQFYFDKLPGEKHLLYEPNTDHMLQGSTAMDDMEAFYRSILRGAPRPQITSHLDAAGNLRITTVGNPHKVVLWQAANAEHRDFRLKTIGPGYHATELQPVSPGVYTAKIDMPKKGWIAFYAEAEFPGEGGKPLRFSTQVYVAPSTEPYKMPKHGETVLEPKDAPPATR